MNIIIGKGSDTAALFEMAAVRFRGDCVGGGHWGSVVDKDVPFFLENSDLIDERKINGRLKLRFQEP